MIRFLTLILIISIMLSLLVSLLALLDFSLLSWYFALIYLHFKVTISCWAYLQHRLFCNPDLELQFLGLCLC